MDERFDLLEFEEFNHRTTNRTLRTSRSESCPVLDRDPGTGDRSPCLLKGKDGPVYRGLRTRVRRLHYLLLPVHGGTRQTRGKEKRGGPPSTRPVGVTETTNPRAGD